MLGDDLEVKTGAQTAADEAAEINEQIGGFLTPALLAFAGAALLVGAFIIFNTFSITVAQRTREFALMRALGATRRQVLGAVAAEALAVGVAASVAGLFVGLGFARGLGALFDAAGMGIPRGAMDLAPRTIVDRALRRHRRHACSRRSIPAVRATRVSPVAAMRDEAPVVRPRFVRAAPRRHGPRRAGRARARRSRACSAAARRRPASARWAPARCSSSSASRRARATSSVRWPRSSGWPLQHLHETTGELARENASRNPGRTAVTSAALMVGLGLVVFVAVFAQGLKDTIDGGIEERLSGELIVSTDSASPLPAGAAARIAAGPAGRRRARRSTSTASRSTAGAANATTDVLNGVEPAALAAGLRLRVARRRGRRLDASAPATR